MENAGVNSNIIAPILGHKPKGTDFHYSEHDIKDLMEKFRMALPYLLPQSMEVLKAEAQRANLLFSEKIDGLRKTTFELRERLADVGNFVRCYIESSQQLSDNEKEALRKKYNLQDFTTGERSFPSDPENYTKTAGRKGYALP